MNHKTLPTAFLQKTGGILELSWYSQDEDAILRYKVRSIGEAERLAGRIGIRLAIDKYGGSIDGR